MPGGYENVPIAAKRIADTGNSHRFLWSEVEHIEN